MFIAGRRLRRALFALSLALAALTAAGGAQQLRPTPVTAVVPTTAETLPFYWALQQGLFEKAGLALTVTTATSGSMATATVVGGAAQIGSSNVLSEIQAHAKGLPIVLLAAAGEYDDRLPNNEIFVAAGSPIRVAHDLEGKTVAIASLHDLLALSMHSWLDREGVDVAKIRFVEMPPSSQVAALQQGRVEAIHVYEPFRGQAERAGMRALVAPYYTIGRDFIFSVWFANATWVNANRDAALKFARVMHDATEYTNAHYEELIPMISSYTKMSPDEIRSMRRVRGSPSLRPALIQPVIDAAAKYHEIEKAFPAQEMILTGVP
jgi:NitT/TauT family transport system substrate-binding protein